MFKLFPSAPVETLVSAAVLRPPAVVPVLVAALVVAPVVAEVSAFVARTAAFRLAAEVATFPPVTVFAVLAEVATLATAPFLAKDVEKFWNPDCDGGT